MHVQGPFTGFYYLPPRQVGSIFVVSVSVCVRLCPSAYFLTHLHIQVRVCRTKLMFGGGCEFCLCTDFPGLNGPKLPILHTPTECRTRILEILVKLLKLGNQGHG